MTALIEGAFVGAGVSLLLEKVLEDIKLLAEGSYRFRGLQSLLDYLQEPAAYLERHEETAGQDLVHNWLSRFRKELDQANVLVSDWQRTRRWNLFDKRKLLKRLLDVTARIESLSRYAVLVAFASNVSNFKKLGEKLVIVKPCLEGLTVEVSSSELAQATKKVLAENRCHPLSLPEAVEGIRRTHQRTIGFEANVRSGFPEAVSHFNPQDPLPLQVFGGDFIVNKVIAEILDGDCRKCIGLWAMGGAGKTLTAARVYSDPRIQSYFNGDRRRIWVTVGKQSTYEVKKEIFRQLGGKEGEFPAAHNVHGVSLILGEHLDNLDNFLLVIDDVWELDQLDFIDLIPEPKQSRQGVILVTTRDKNILEGKHATIIEVSLLSEDDSWKLFSMSAFGGEQKVPNELRDVPRSVAAECKGLPLALKVISSTLAGKTDLRVWQNSLKKLKQASVLGKKHEEQVFGRLQLSVDNLRDLDDSRLLDCFYYFAAFPEDAEIDATELVSLWTADGIVGSDPDHVLSPENEAYELLGELIALSMIEVHTRRSISMSPTRCKIHDVMRDLARYNLENNFGNKDSKAEKVPACQRLCLYRPGLQLATIPEDWMIREGAHTTTSSRFSVERLSFISNRLQQLPEQFDGPGLRVLLLGKNKTLRLLPHRFFESFTILRVLDLQHTGVEEIPEAVFNLISLVLLNLNGCRSLRYMAASIERLHNLQQLRVRGCDRLTSLPKGVSKLKSLKVLDTWGTEIWEHESPIAWAIAPTPRHFALLQDVVHLKNSLQSWNIASRSLSRFPEIGELTALQNLELGCWALEELPGSFSKLINLNRLRLFECQSLIRLPALDELPHLEKLELVNCLGLTSFPDSFGRSGAFPSLQSFNVRFMELDGMPILQRGAMPQIESFVINRLGRLKELPLSFQVLGSLTYLEVSMCESLERLLAFDEPDSFPYLKEINFSRSISLRNLPTGLLKSAPNLRRLNCGFTGVRSDIPEDILEKQKLQQLEICW